MPSSKEPRVSVSLQRLEEALTASRTKLAERIERVFRPLERSIGKLVHLLDSDKTSAGGPASSSTGVTGGPSEGSDAGVDSSCGEMKKEKRVEDMTVEEAIRLAEEERLASAKKKKKEEDDDKALQEAIEQAEREAKFGEIKKTDEKSREEEIERAIQLAEEDIKQRQTNKRERKDEKETKKDSSSIQQLMERIRQLEEKQTKNRPRGHEKKQQLRDKSDESPPRTRAGRRSRKSDGEEEERVKCLS